MYNAAVMTHPSCRQLLISYFDAGYTYEVILKFLHHLHGIKLSLRTLKRLLSKMGLRRRGHNNDLGFVSQCMEVIPWLTFI